MKVDVHQTWRVSTHTQSAEVITDIDDWVCRTRKEPFAVLRQAQAKHAALVCMYDSTKLVGIEAVNLTRHQMQESAICSATRTNISPPCVPAKMYCEDSASARIDLSCFMRWESAGVRSMNGSGWSGSVVPTVPMAVSLCGGTAVGMVSLAPKCTLGVVPAWSRVMV